MLTLKAFCIRIICQKRIIEISRDIKILYKDSWSVPNQITDEIKAIICSYYSDVTLNFPISIESIINYHFRAFHIMLDLAFDSHYPCPKIFRSNQFRKAFMFIYPGSYLNYFHFVIYRNQTEIFQALKDDPFSLQHLQYPTLRQSKTAIRSNGLAIKYVPKYQRSEKILSIAIKSNGLALKYIKKQNLSMCINAVNQNISAFKFTRFQTPAMCKKAVCYDAHFIKYVISPSDRLTLFVVNEKPYLIQYIKKQSEKVRLECVRKNGAYLCLINFQNERICLQAVRNSGLALKHVKKKSFKICLAAIKENIHAYKYVPSNIKPFILKKLKKK